VNFTDEDPNGNLSQYSGTISWGDGTTSGGSFKNGPLGGFVFIGMHVYSAAGTYSITVAVHDVGGASATATTTLVVP